MPQRCDPCGHGARALVEVAASYFRRLVRRLLGAAPSWSSVMRRGHWIVTRPWQSWAFNRLEMKSPSPFGQQSYRVILAL